LPFSQKGFSDNQKKRRRKRSNSGHINRIMTHLIVSQFLNIINWLPGGVDIEYITLRVLQFLVQLVFSLCVSEVTNILIVSLCTGTLQNKMKMNMCRC
jgi:hypothetical protein